MSIEFSTIRAFFIKKFFSSILCPAAFAADSPGRETGKNARGCFHELRKITD
jgi:hypothetical protein